MICLRCGRCCKELCVAIVDDPAKGPAEDNLLMHEGGGVPCKHLKGDQPGEYSCALHDEEWYEETPCFQHTQVGRDDAPCRMGVHTMKKEYQDALLVRLEEFAATNYGRINSAHLSGEDIEQCEKWHKEGYIRFGNTNPGDGWLTFCVILSDPAWDRAHAKRRQMGNRCVEGIGNALLPRGD